MSKTIKLYISWSEIVSKFINKYYLIQISIVSNKHLNMEMPHPSQNQQEPELDNQIFPGDENLGIHKLIDLKMIV